MRSLAPARRTVANSGLEDSHEFLVTDLRESEFDVLLKDNRRDAFFEEVVLSEFEGEVRTHPMWALAVLETKVGR